MRKKTFFVHILTSLIIFSGITVGASHNQETYSFEYKANIGDSMTYNCTKFVYLGDHSYLEIDPFVKNYVQMGEQFKINVTKVDDSDILGKKETQNLSVVGSIAHYIFKVADSRSYYENIKPDESGKYSLTNNSITRTVEFTWIMTGVGKITVNKTFSWNIKNGWLEYEYQKYTYISELLVELEIKYVTFEQNEIVGYSPEFLPLVFCLLPIIAISKKRRKTLK